MTRPHTSPDSSTFPDSRLQPQDFDRALRRLKDDLALKALRRRLLDPGLDAREVLAVTQRIEEIQGRIRAARRWRILHPVAPIRT